MTAQVHLPVTAAKVPITVSGSTLTITSEVSAAAVIVALSSIVTTSIAAVVAATIPVTPKVTATTGISTVIAITATAVFTRSIAAPTAASSAAAKSATTSTTSSSALAVRHFDADHATFYLQTHRLRHGTLGIRGGIHRHERVPTRAAGGAVD
jgi:hypothetical protein